MASTLVAMFVGLKSFRSLPPLQFLPALKVICASMWDHGVRSKQGPSWTKRPMSKLVHRQGLNNLSSCKANKYSGKDFLLQVEMSFSWRLDDFDSRCDTIATHSTQKTKAGWRQLLVDAKKSNKAQKAKNSMWREGLPGHGYETRKQMNNDECLCCCFVVSFGSCWNFGTLNLQRLIDLADLALVDWRPSLVG